MNWGRVLYRRRACLEALITAKSHAVYAGDRPVVAHLVGLIARQRDRVHYAMKMEKRAERLPRIFTPVNVPFAPSDNPPDNPGLLRS